MKNLFKHIKPVDREFDRVNAELASLRRKMATQVVSSGESASSGELAEKPVTYKMKYFDYRDERREIDLRKSDLGTVIKFLQTYIADKEDVKTT